MPVNEQITDSVTQVNTKVVGETPAMAMGNLLMPTSQALAVQDAANNMRDMNDLLSTASGVALANFIESGDVKYLETLQTLNTQANQSISNFIDLYQSVNQQKNPK